MTAFGTYDDLVHDFNEVTWQGRCGAWTKNGGLMGSTRRKPNCLLCIATPR